ncbi:MAG: nucleoside-diphosphate sugar epimerase/dehydratase [Pseudomonadota bacterium]
MKVRLTRNLFFILALDIVLVALAFYFAHLIRFDFNIPKWALDNLLSLIVYCSLIKIACFFVFDLYRGMWRYTSLTDLMNVGKASIVSSVCVILFVLYTTGFNGVPRSVFIIDWCLTLISIIGLRVAARLYFEQVGLNRNLSSLATAISSVFIKKKNPGTLILIIGAGNCGEKLIREIYNNTSVKYNVCGFLDDDPKKIGRKIHGIPVLGEICLLDQMIGSTGATEVIIAIPSASPQRMREIVTICKDVGIRHKTVPNMGELINGKITVNSIRNVEYRDLLRRKPVILDKDKIGEYLGNKTVLVTGGGGSIGQGLCQQICRYHPSKLIIFEIAESPLYEIDLQLKKEFQTVDIIPVLGDIRDKEELRKVFKTFQPEIIFHAAAYKHVPMLEAHPWKAIDNNIIGTKNVVEVTDEFCCEKFVFVSTDKAVNPANIMGTSKRIAEMIVQNRNHCTKSKTNFIIVRFGNVIGSVGSVIPLFKRQISEGGPVTVTHPDIIRYFMLIPEACQLILQAGAMGNGGEIFVLEMGEPVKIDDMARDLILFSGFEPDVDIKIEYTGLRPGEKLFEELMTDNENVIPTNHSKIMVLTGKTCNMDIMNGEIESLKDIAENQSREEIIDQLKKLVPEYKPH